MKDKTYNNADSFAISFDEEWEKVDCNDTAQKIENLKLNIKYQAIRYRKIPIKLLYGLTHLTL